MSEWFETRPVRPGLWMIAEPLHVVSWLYVGAERAALIDSGTGIVPIAPVVAGLTAAPVLVVNTHYHFDHIGGNPAYETRLASAAGAALLTRPASRDLLGRYVRELAPALDMTAAKIALDPDIFLGTPEQRMRPLPQGFALDAWRPGGVPPSGVLAEGDVIDLGGGTRLRVIETPGHSPDGICLLDEEAGILFAGDTLNEGTIYAHYVESSLPALLGSVRKLTAHAASLHCLCAGHVARAIAEISLIADVEAAVAAVLDGAPLSNSTDVFGYKVRAARFGRVSITQPHPASDPVILAD